MIRDYCENKGKKLIVDPKSSDWMKYRGSYLITPNFKEFTEAVGYSLENDEKNISEHAADFMKKYDLERLLVTRSQYGMILVEIDRQPLTIKAKQREVYDVSGAGDTVIAMIAAALSTGYELGDAIELSNLATGIAVSKPGTYMVTLEDMLVYFNDNGLWYEGKIRNLTDISVIVDVWRQHNEKIVFTNGCFDILHMGHIDYLQLS